MNVFEDLIEELREENLLEHTVIDLRSAGYEDPSEPADTFDSEFDPTAAMASVPDGDAELDDSSELSGKDFYRKRAVDEISCLQMVEHILSGIEREHLKAVPTSYDDLEAKKALHKYLQVEGDTSTTEYADAEFQLMRETETWNSVLAKRDRKISVANLRRFCENSRPVLSSQALVGLARFYRNAPFSELTREKFEFVMTRLFSREIDGEKRKLLFGRSDMKGHIKTLYANWASVALYSTDEPSVKAKTIVAGLAEKQSEAEGAETFDDLIRNDFFKKIHGFKEATGEMFFTPEVVAATIECNTRVGNKFVDLIQRERLLADLDSLEQKYGFEYDQEVSNAAGRTLEIIELLKNLPTADAKEVHERESQPVETEAKTKSSESRRRSRRRFEIFGVNKWLLAATILIVSTSGGLYFWADKQPADQETSAESASDVNLNDSELKDFVRSARSTPSTLYAITLPTWDQLSVDKKKDLLRQGLNLVSRTGQKSVQFVNARGRVEGFASGDKVEVKSSQ
ncbi:MAG: hypothetical protein DMF63_04555 [Acidobacteria bacterium]|nr:MAG: hypothetical protein DMF63_04555 [Acidobacteriota bacterium]